MITTSTRIETRKIAKSLCDMTNVIMKNHMLARTAIIKNNKKLAADVLKKDKLVDAQFYFIESDIEFMITKALVDKDLRRILAYLHIVRNLEKIGDYAKKIAHFIIKNNEFSTSSVKRIIKIHDKFKKMLRQVCKIIIDEDVLLAREIWASDSDIDKLVHQIRKDVIASISNRSNKRAIEERVFVLNVINSFERACDHILNICELIQYIKTGKHVNFF